MTQASERIRAIFKRLLADAQEVDPTLRAYVCLGEASEFPTERACAYTLHESYLRPTKIVVAPRMEELADDRVEAVLRHEFGHALLLAAGVHEHSERDADVLAETLWDDPIFYDDLDIQSLCCGIRPRPVYLPQ